MPFFISLTVSLKPFNIGGPELLKLVKNLVYLNLSQERVGICKTTRSYLNSNIVKICGIRMKNKDIFPDFNLYFTMVCKHCFQWNLKNESLKTAPLQDGL